MTLKEHYQTLLPLKLDISEHLETLRKLASQCKSVAEFGAGFSTIALLVAQPERLDSYDILKHAQVRIAEGCPEKTRFTFHCEDTTKTVIEPADMLFIDTKHTAEQVYAELCHNADKVSKWLVFHDTVSCGEVDAVWPGPPLGILWGIGRYMHEHEGQWRIIADYSNCNGLRIYERI